VAASKVQDILTVEFRLQHTSGLSFSGDEAYMPVTLAVRRSFSRMPLRKVRGETPGLRQRCIQISMANKRIPIGR